MLILMIGKYPLKMVLEKYNIDVILDLVFTIFGPFFK